ncbi:MAG: efflux RND transporter permease subunit [Rhodospirillaceae bacterium]|nr:efflux RND transporter permease subunit [Rhodospirillaceae bacterium]
MTLTDLCIKRPVLATVMNLVILLLGAIAIGRLQLREYPDIEQPTITVNTHYPGASAEIIESQVTEILENQLAAVDGVDQMKSSSRSEQSQIVITFNVTRDIDLAANEVRDRIGQARALLPQEVRDSVVSKGNLAAGQIIWISVRSKTLSDLEVSELAETVVADRIENAPGVANVRVVGARRYAMRVWLDKARLAAYALTTQDVEAALRAQNVEVPAGKIENVAREFSILSDTSLSAPEQFGQIVLKNSDGYLVRLADVATVELGPEDDRVISEFNGVSGIALGVTKQSTANALDVARAIKAEMPKILAQLPPEMEADIVYDKTLFIEQSIQSVYVTIAEAVALVVLVIFFFIRSVRATVIPMLTIPISLVGGFFLMYLLDFSINTLTLLSAVVAIGLVVDDAIVVLENCYRHVEAGKTPMEAALQGSRQIAFAVVAMTVTLAAVFVPVAFTQGITGRFFAEFALTLAGIVLVSGFVALTLTPLMCSRMLKAKTHHGRFDTLVESSLEKLKRAYLGALHRLLGLRMIVVVVAVVIGGATAALFLTLPSELAPPEDRGIVVGVLITPEGSTVEYTAQYAKEMQALFLKQPDVTHIFAMIGFPVPSSTFSYAGLKDWPERAKTLAQTTAELRRDFFQIRGGLAFPNTPPPLEQDTNSRPVDFVVQTSGTHQDLKVVVDQLMAAMRQNPNIVSPDTDLKLNQPQLRIDMNRDKLAALDIKVDTVGRTLETMMGGRKVTRFKRGGEQYDVIVQVADIDRRNPDDLNSIFIRGRDGEMVQVGNLVSVSENVSPVELNHFNRMRSAKVTANLAPGYSLGEALAFLDDAAAKLDNPDVSFDVDGVSREFKRSSGAMYVTFLLALAFIYLVLAAQFESFIDPVIILLAVPLAICGALATIKLTGGSLNIYSQIGLITLVGLISKHGILIVEFSNRLRDKGLPVAHAVLGAAELRLRPILMTTGAMVLGAMPLALATGAGSEGRQAIGWVIVGGMLFGTLLTIFVVPAFYALIKGRAVKSTTRSIGHAADKVAQAAE